MPIEIRELSIHTRIAGPGAPQQALSAKDLQQLKKQLLQECMKALKASAKKSGLDR